MAEPRIVSASSDVDDAQFEAGLRPRRLKDFTGQTKLKENLAIAIEAARHRGEAMDHVLLYGPPGLGKTTLAAIIAAELDVAFDQTSGPVLQKKLDLSGVLTNIQERQIFFIDEIHRLMPDIEEMLYSALEDFQLDLLIGSGPGARTMRIPIQRFTAVGATTRQGLVSAPLRGRFGLVLHLNHYSVDELKTIVSALGAAARCGESTIMELPKLRAAAGERRVSRTGCCAACAIMRRCARMDAFRWALPKRRWTYWKWTASVWTRSIRRS